MERFVVGNCALKFPARVSCPQSRMWQRSPDVIPHLYSPMYSVAKSLRRRWFADMNAFSCRAGHGSRGPRDKVLQMDRHSHSHLDLVHTGAGIQ